MMLQSYLYLRHDQKLQHEDGFYRIESWMLGKGIQLRGNQRTTPVLLGWCYVAEVVRGPGYPLSKGVIWPWASMVIFCVAREMVV